MGRKRKDYKFAERIARKVEELGERAAVHYEEGKMRRIGEVMMKWRLLSAKSQQDVAKELGISVSSLRRLEANKQAPDGDTQLKIIVWLFTEEPDASANRTDSSEPIDLGEGD